MAQHDAFRREVRVAMVRRDWTLDDLAAKVTEKTGLFCDTSYLSRILSGQRNPPKIVDAIREILDLDPGNSSEKVG